MNREVAIELGYIEAEGSQIELAFSTGFMFWEIDQVRLAKYQPVPETRIRMMDPVQAIDEKGNDVLASLKMNDRVFLEQPEIGNRAYLTYSIPDYSSVKGYSAFLHSYGYYEPIRDYKGEANLSFLNEMRNPGAFAAYSKDKYRNVVQSAYLASKKQ